jgi:cell division protein FtsI (penicillin-binding protein 3)
MKLELQKGSRSKVLAGLLIAMVVIFVGRLFQLQILDHAKYVAAAAAEQVKITDLPAQRGLIYGMNGTTPDPLALNQTVYTVFADPTTVVDDSKIISTIESVAGGSAEPNLQGLLNAKDSRYEILATDITLTQATKIKAANLNGIGFQAITQRVYPEGTLAAQVLGFVNNVGQGQYGVEQGLNKELSGTDGVLKAVTDVNDVPLTIGKDNIDKPAVDGKNVALTIDLNVQAEAEQALSDGLKKNHATNGSIIVINPQNGHVEAMANLPSYDPANFGQASDASDYNNPIVSSPYEPGSDMKTLTMAIGVDKGVVTPDTTYNNTGSMTIDGTNVSNGEGLGHLGTITMQTAMDFSLNSGFITVAELLGDGQNITLAARNTMYDYYYNHFHIGQLTGIQVSGEDPGTIISPNDPSGQGNAVRYSNMAFGQGIDATMLQMSAAFSSIVDGGLYYTPTVVAGTVDDNGNLTPASQVAAQRSVSQATADTVRNMTQVARASLFSSSDTPGFQIGGKTGTSQTLINGNYNNNQTIGTYLGYGGDDTPRYVIMVQVSGAGQTLEGGRDAEPIFAEMSNWMLNYLQLQPKG